MEPVLFYGVPSGCSLASIIALEWLGKPYRLSRVEMLEQPWEPGFASINPKMKTPALVLEDGSTLTESLAILTHIARRGKTDRGDGAIASASASASASAGASPKAKSADDALAETLSYLTTDFFSAFAPLWLAYETKDLDPGNRAMLRAQGEAAVKREFDHLNLKLENKDWLLEGAGPSVADAYLFAVARWADYHAIFDTERQYPEVFRYLSRLREEPAVRFALDIEGGKAPSGNGAFLGHVTLHDVLPRVLARG